MHAMSSESSSSPDLDPNQRHLDMYPLRGASELCAVF